MKASTTYRNFIIMVILLTIQSCQQENNAETKDNTVTVTTANPIRNKKVADSASLENSIQVDMFIQQIALGGMFEIAIGKLAIDKAQDSDIKSFAEQMIQEYSRINLEISALSATKGLRLPGVLQQKQQRQVQEMNTMKNEYFEKLYLKIVIHELDKYIELFKSALNSPDGEVSHFAQKFLPVLQMQRQGAYELPGSIR
ncbi:DUF4142 domain-containing protein [Pedobacter sp. B4-66]|uniref:DUF4142 domain-containing protein n=1 Tax=Pedobacter sp. B4-66 TaxID=2817280 RepID=UPI001BDACFF6|nr:DUF4142 domain-containing protein [Pedobacter sp. B4-66]